MKPAFFLSVVCVNQYHPRRMASRRKSAGGKKKRSTKKRYRRSAAKRRSLRCPKGERPRCRYPVYVEGKRSKCLKRGAQTYVCKKHDSL